MPRPYGDVSSAPEILKFGLRMHFNFFSKQLFLRTTVYKKL